MTEYNDVPDAATLYQQREIVTQAIWLIDSGGYLANVSIASNVGSGGTMMGMGSVSVAMPPPTSPEMMKITRAWMVDRQAEIDQQLADLGVTNPPAAARQSDAA